MRSWWQADVDHIQLGIGEHLVNLFVGVDAGEIHLGPGGPEVSLDGPPIAGQPRAVLLAHGGDFHALQTAISQVVDHAHETDSRDADSNHSRAPALADET